MLGINSISAYGLKRPVLKSKKKLNDLSWKLNLTVSDFFLNWS